MHNFGSFDAFIVKPTIMPDFARNLLHYVVYITHKSMPVTEPMHSVSAGFPSLVHSSCMLESGNPDSRQLRDWSLITEKGGGYKTGGGNK